MENHQSLHSKPNLNFNEQMGNRSSRTLIYREDKTSTIKMNAKLLSDDSSFSVRFLGKSLNGNILRLLALLLTTPSHGAILNYGDNIILPTTPSGEPWGNSPLQVNFPVITADSGNIQIQTLYPNGQLSYYSCLGPNLPAVVGPVDVTNGFTTGSLYWGRPQRITPTAPLVSPLIMTFPAKLDTAGISCFTGRLPNGPYDVLLGHVIQRDSSNTEIFREEIRVVGTNTNASCSIDSPTIDFGEVKDKSVGSVLADQNFTTNITCGPVGALSITFDSPSKSSELFLPNPARGIGVRILSNGSPINPGVPIPSSDFTNLLSLTAELVQTSSTTVAGPFSLTADMTFSYY